MRLEDVKPGLAVRILPSANHVHGGRLGTVVRLEATVSGTSVVVRFPDGFASVFWPDELEPTTEVRDEA